MRRGLLLAILLLLLNQPATIAERASVPGKVAFIRHADLWLWEKNQEQRLTEGGGVTAPKLSHDGQYIAFVQDEALWVVSPGRAPWRVASTPMTVNWSPTANTLAVAQARGVSTLRITTDGPEQPQLLAAGWSDPAWSPDGRLIALTRNTGQENFIGTAEIGLASMADRAPRTIWKAPYNKEAWVGPVNSLKWSADGQWLAAYRSALSASISADSDQLIVLPTTGSSMTPLSLGPMNPAYFAWAPTGATLAYTDGIGRFAWGEKQIKLLQMPPSNKPFSPTPSGYADREPAWSPDGQHLFFIRSRATAPQLMYQPAEEQAIWRLTLQTGHQEAVSGTEEALGVKVGPNGRLLWPKGDGKRASLYTDGQQHAVVENLDFPCYYYGQFGWAAVFDWWPGKRD